MAEDKWRKLTWAYLMFSSVAVRPVRICLGVQTPASHLPSLSQRLSGFFLASNIFYSGFMSFHLHRILLKPQQMQYRFPVVTDSVSPDGHMCANRKGVTVCSEDDLHMPW